MKRVLTRRDPSRIYYRAPCQKAFFTALTVSCCNVFLPLQVYLQFDGTYSALTCRIGSVFTFVSMSRGGSKLEIVSLR